MNGDKNHSLPVELLNIFVLHQDHPFSINSLIILKN